MKKTFDIILVLDYFRSAAAYLCIIKYLGSNFRVGVYVAPAAKDAVNKVGSAHSKFVEKCVEFGAELVEDRPVSCKLLIVQQRPYKDTVVKRVLSQISADRVVGYLGFATAGIEKHDKFLTQFNIKRAYVPNRRFFNYLLSERQVTTTYASVDVVQVGLPFDQYPVFPEFRADYLIANPTLFSFHNESDKHIYLRNVMALLSQIRSNAEVAYKPHNGHSKDSLRRRGYAVIATVLGCLPNAERLIQNMVEKATGTKLHSILEKIMTAFLSKRLLRRVIPMNKLTKDSDFALEAFMPGVSGGIIGGLSNTIWGTHYFGLNYFNCVDDSKQHRATRNALLGKNSADFLDLNLGYFYVPCCHGRLDSPSIRDDLIGEEDRRGDLMASIREDLN